MSLTEQIDSDLKSAMKAKNELALSTLRMLKAAIKNKEIDKKTKALPDPEVVEVLQKQVKQRKDSITEYQKANRTDLAAKEQNEITIIEKYLPKGLSESELKAVIEKAIQASGAKSKADVGRVMKEVMPQVAGRADGKTINQIALSLLN